MDKDKDMDKDMDMDIDIDIDMGVGMDMEGEPPISPLRVSSAICPAICSAAPHTPSQRSAQKNTEKIFLKFDTRWHFVSLSSIKKCDIIYANK